MACRVVGVRFRRAGKIYYFDPGEYHLKPGDQVIVETARGVENGEVVLGPREVSEKEVAAPLKRIIRPATPEDLERIKLKKEKEREAFSICLEKIAAHGLPMKLVEVEQTFDGSKLIFYFTAEGRVDFRELVKDLAAVFRTRIELRQIGVRDEAKLRGGLGCCGRELCCHTWLSDFTSVSIRMAKDQNLSLNPAKISGLCGRLMCCLKFENEIYEEAKIEHPEIGCRVMTPDGEGRVAAVNIFRKAVVVELKESKLHKEYAFHQVISLKARGEQGGGSDQLVEGNGGPAAGPAGRSGEAEAPGPPPGGGK